MLDTELLEQLRTAHCAALVLCHTLSDEEAEEAARLAKEEMPDIKIIALSKSSPAFDESFGSFVRPETLLSVLKRNLALKQPTAFASNRIG